MAGFNHKRAGRSKNRIRAFSNELHRNDQGKNGDPRSAATAFAIQIDLDAE